MVKISVLMYIYNSEKYLEESINTLLNQSFNDLEVICINDESMDNSSNILKKYAKTCSQIKLVSLKHSGFSKAINQCIYLTNGQYIYFMNLGHNLKTAALEKLYDTAMKTNADLIISNTAEDNGLLYTPSESNFEENIFDYKKIGENIFNINTSLENKLFKSDIIKNNNIDFSQIIYGNTLFVYKNILCAEKISFINYDLCEKKYYYKLPATKDNYEFKDNITEINDIVDLFKEKTSFEDYKEFIYEYKMNYIIDGYYKIKESERAEYFNQWKRDSVNILSNNEECDEFLNNISDYHRKIFEQIIISENSSEFDYLRQTYSQKQKCEYLYHHNIKKLEYDLENKKE